MRDGRVEILDLLGGARFFVVEPRSMVGVEIGDVAELRLLGLDDDVYFAKTFVYHPKAARDDIVAHAQTVLRQGGSRSTPLRRNRRAACVCATLSASATCSNLQNGQQADVSQLGWRGARVARRRYFLPYARIICSGTQRQLQACL